MSSATPSWQRSLAASGPFRWFARAHGAAVRRAYERRARPLPASRPDTRCLVLAPHPDDETLGCALLVHDRVAAGATVTVVVATDGRHSHRSAVISPCELADVRRQESISACRLLGVHDVRFFDFEERSLSDRHDALVDAIANVLDEVRPNEVYVTSERDGHADHRALAGAARRAVAARAGLSLYEYPIWFWEPSSWATGSNAAAKAIGVVFGPFRHLRRVDVWQLQTDAPHALKVDAIDLYRSQVSNLTGEPGWAVLDDVFLGRFLGRQELFLTGRAP